MPGGWVGEVALHRRGHGCGSPTGTSVPTPATRSRRPPVSVATTGTPAAIASCTTSARASQRLGSARTPRRRGASGRGRPAVRRSAPAAARPRPAAAVGRAGPRRRPRRPPTGPALRRAASTRVSRSFWGAILAIVSTSRSPNSAPIPLSCNSSAARARRLRPRGPLEQGAPERVATAQSRGAHRGHRADGPRRQGRSWLRSSGLPAGRRVPAPGPRASAAGRASRAPRCAGSRRPECGSRLRPRWPAVRPGGRGRARHRHRGPAGAAATGAAATRPARPPDRATTAALRAIANRSAVIGSVTKLTSSPTARRPCARSTACVPIPPVLRPTSITTFTGRSPCVGFGRVGAGPAWPCGRRPSSRPGRPAG